MKRHNLNSLFGSRRKQCQSLTGLELRSQLFQRFGLGKQFVDRNTKHFGQKHEFAIGHPAQLRFQFPQGTNADAPALQLQFLSENGLGPTVAVAVPLHLRSHDIQRQLHPRRLNAALDWIHSYMRMKSVIVLDAHLGFVKPLAG